MRSEREGGVKLFMRTCLAENTVVGRLANANTTDISNTSYVVWAQPSIIECTITEIQGMDAAIQQRTISK